MPINIQLLNIVNAKLNTGAAVNRIYDNIICIGKLFYFFIPRDL